VERQTKPHATGFRGAKQVFAGPTRSFMGAAEVAAEKTSTISRVPKTAPKPVAVPSQCDDAMTSSLSFSAYDSPIILYE